MPTDLALVTGADGFVGRWVVRALERRGVAIRTDDDLDVFDDAALRLALDGVGTLYHCRELTDEAASRAAHLRENVEVTRNLWAAAKQEGVPSALFLSHTAVYGLLSRSPDPLDEDVPARAVEPYGLSKRLAEVVAHDVADAGGPRTIILRPAAMFGPGAHSDFASNLRDAIPSRLLLAGAFPGRRFSFVHVEDVAEAAVHLTTSRADGGWVFNVAVPEAIGFDEAFSTYVRALRGLGRRGAGARRLALLSRALHRAPWLGRLLERRGGGRRLGFSLWRDGYDLTYASDRLLETGFRYRWTDFEAVLLASAEADAGPDSVGAGSARSLGNRTA